MAALASGKIHFDKTYRIFVKYCVPSAPYSNDTARSIQVLTHGAALDHSYWDFGPGYSYQHAAAAAGLATISYDRLGIGKSDIPDPLFEVNSMSTLEILHGLNSVVRSGGLGRHYNKIIGVGHSLGSAVTQTIPAKFPLDFDAIILTGFVSTPPPTITAGALGFLKANDNPRLGHLPDGYILPGVPTGVHLSFFKYPNFDPAILEESVNRMQTQALGELLAAPGIIDEVDLSSLKNYSSPVLIVNGENDFSACGFSCVTPRDMTKDTLKDGWPAADPILSDTMVHAGLGHNLNTHLSAEAVYNGMIGWVQKVESS
ncbi:uncharacterized protein CTRU02_207264 [Colletotrichum truncatum]|uniref:Uncharacterized protein n=1 Tax=Colletotrichum truncatum TaxID=5467 RepID=A0ACC3Z0D6_COLTU|nr:uncharacterized protein CTRU02_01100 [Colletotrichum truncatum]KAF6800695.1 hypothetical protein CTRU02_01100 [Colletotrichum truncatum]